MTKAEQARIVAWRLRILQHAESEPRQVARTCRYFGISRTAFYRWKKRFDEFGEAGLADRPRTPHRSPRATPPAVVSKILYLRQNYHFGAGRIAVYLQRFHQVEIARSSVHRILVKNGMGRLPANQKHKPHRKRWKRYEKAQRNVELIWLTGRLMPAFKTIADFRKDNRQAIRKVCLAFVELCRELELFSAALVAIDGSKFKAVNSRDKNFTRKSVKQRLKNTQRNIDRYLAKLDAVDAEEPEIREVTATELKQKIASMEAKMEELKARQAEVEAHPDQQVSSTDADARSMMKPGGGSVVGYNVQTAVDEKHHLIAAHEVTNDTTDRQQLGDMAKQARQALKTKTLTVVADAGYYEGESIAGCYEAGIRALVPKTNTSPARAEGRYSKADFLYDAKRNEYVCPANERLTYRFDSVERGKKLWVYMRYGCSSCPLHKKCTTGNAKRLKRWETEHILDRAAAELSAHTDAMRRRKAIAEHPYSTIKQSMGMTHFLTKRLPSVKAEMSLHVLAYNMKRAINVLGTTKIMNALQPV